MINNPPYLLRYFYLGTTLMENKHKRLAQAIALSLALFAFKNLYAVEPIKPLPLTVKLNPDKVALGEQLFNDKRLSHDNTVACVSCHDLQKGGTDRLPHSLGINNAEGDINAPTVFNSSFNFRQFWDGRAATLEEQIEGPVHNPKEMGSHWQEIIGKLKKEAAYLKAFKALYADGINAKNIKDAIATFERSLITPNAPFDQYLRGDETALTDEEKQGYALFKQYVRLVSRQGIVSKSINTGNPDRNVSPLQGGTTLIMICVKTTSLVLVGGKS
jgi:cytochrome c peroxidase